MKVARIFFFLGLMVWAFGVNGQQKIEKHDLTTVFGWMSGIFSSEAQSKKDSAFFSISLKMRPVWHSRKGDHWLYVEQAMSLAQDKPYRQRVYHLTLEGDSILLSSVYELPGPNRFIGAAERPEMLDRITPDSLIKRQGCAISLKKTDTHTYSGSTPGKLCHSSLRGASYATSKVTITKHQIVSWDQGFDGNDKQIWGATKGGYQFVKIQPW